MSYFFHKILLIDVFDFYLTGIAEIIVLKSLDINNMVTNAVSYLNLKNIDNE